MRFAPLSFSALCLLATVTPGLVTRPNSNPHRFRISDQYLHHNEPALGQYGCGRKWKLCRGLGKRGFER